MGYISAFTVPPTATVGGTINATMRTAIYSQNWEDFSIIWGLAAPQYSCDTCVGTKVGYTALTGQEGQAYPYTFTELVTVPDGTAAGEYILTAAIPRLIGASGTTGFSYYRSNITIS